MLKMTDGVCWRKPRIIIENRVGIQKMKRDGDLRTRIVFHFILVLIIAGTAMMASNTFHLLPQHRIGNWDFVDRVEAVLACVVLGVLGVLASIRFGIRHFSV